MVLLPTWCWGGCRSGVGFFPWFPFFYSRRYRNICTRYSQREGSFKTLMNEQRIWMIKSIIPHLNGSVDVLLKRIGMREANFLTTNKVEDDVERDDLYQKGMFDFRTSTMFLAPMVALIILNMVSFLVGIGRAVFVVGDLNKMFVQLFMSIYILVVNYPIIEGMIIRKDKGRVPSSVIALSAVFCVVFLAFSSIILLYQAWSTNAGFGSLLCLIFDS